MDVVKDPQLERIDAIMNDCTFPWSIAGGWSIDLTIGRKTREHQDMDIVVFREYVQDVLNYFSDWQVGVVIPGEHRLEVVIDKNQVELPRYCLHLQHEQDFVEVLITDHANDQVIYRRNPSITIPLQDFIRIDSMNRRYVTPEWQLLFKAKSPRECDRQDFINALNYLDVTQKEWLRHALMKTHASSEWVDLLW